MKLLIVTRDRTAAGRVTESRREASAARVRVGRRASCEVLLADPQVALDQGVLVDRQGLVYTEEERLGSGVAQPAGPRTVRLGAGDSVDVGPFRLTASPGEEGFDATLTVERIHPATEDASSLRERARHLTLGTAGLSRRSLAWALFLVSLVVFLVWPAGKVFDLPWAGLATPGWASDRAWNPGALMLAHQALEGKCEACHQVAFQQTADAACLECHQKVGHHVAQTLNPATLFEGVRCAECHRDHKGLKARHRDDDRFCVDCHQDIQKRAPGVESRNVADFAREHPAFRLSLPGDKGEPLKRVRQEKAPITHRSGLVFPHDVHLDRAGVKHPDKGTIQLDCDACHRPDTAKRSFEPISMGRHCQECHKLEFEPAVTSRQVPHASPAEAMTVVREFYANLALNGVPDSFQKAFGVPGEGLLRRVGDPSPAQRQNALAIAQRKAEQVGEELFEIRACKTCHELIREDTSQGRRWTVTRVLNGHTWMPHARFDHKAHAQAKCSDCHDVAKSKRAEDLAMPTIETCRDCHAGSKPVLDRLPSNCLLCHGFHEHANPWDPTFKPKNPSPRLAGTARAP